MLQRVERIIDEKTGKIIESNSDCVTPEGFVCEADYHRLCTRSVYEYQREIWARAAVVSSLAR